MKLFWKIFLSVVSVMILIFCISGHLFIDSFFHTSLQGKINTAEKENLSFLQSMKEISVSQDGTIEREDWELGRIARNVQLMEVPGLQQLCVYNASGIKVFLVSDFSTERYEKALIRRAQEDVTAYEFVEQDGRYFLYVANKLREDHRTLFSTMSVIEVTELFEEKNEQYQMFMQGMLCLMLITALLAFILAFWIVKPIRKLLQAVKKIGEGDFSQKIEVNTEDEIGNLAEEFNRMSSHLEEMIGELREAARRQEEFTGSFAHELKTPLTSVIGYADMLRTKRMSEETRMIYGDYIFKQGKRLETLSRKMLELIVLKNTEFTMREVRLSELLEQIVEELEMPLQEKEISFQYKVEELSILAEPDLIHTVFLNLIDNARKAVEKEGKIMVYAVKKEEKITVSISDNGKGMSEETVQKATESFYMEDKSRKYEENSAGLGLSICEKILELHNTRMRIQSEEGKGTTIYISFEGVI